METDNGVVLGVLEGLVVLLPTMPVQPENPRRTAASPTAVINFKTISRLAWFAAEPIVLAIMSLPPVAASSPLNPIFPTHA